MFLSNEHPNFVDLYFDDVTVSHTPSPIVSTSDYFPFGLSYNSMERTGSLEQKYLYNGKELQDEMVLNWYDYGARMYMPETFINNTECDKITLAEWISVDLK